jgi:pre-rRNA-processing protein TSR1
MAPIVAQSHHHRSTTKQSKKGFKSRHATKSSLKEQSKGTPSPTTPLSARCP